ncbi:MAG: DUF853 family protein [Sandaracinus sp.]|nr:DUF853 family protein [Sandaracinus sp.]
MLLLGQRRDDLQPFELPPSVLVRHVAALGASGSGKTVFCKVLVEESVRAGIPAICIDPQGDLCSLLLRADPKELVAHGVDPALAEDFHAKVDVVLFTPASTVGVPLCVDPIDGDLLSLRADERVRAQTRAAQRLTSLLGFDLDGDDGAAITAVVDRALGELVDAGVRPSIGALAERLAEPARYAALAKPAKIEGASQRLARLEVGSRRLLFGDGVPLDVPRLLGRDESALPGRTRISVIYLNTLDAQEDKEFFLAALAERLYAWMLTSPSVEPQALFYVDEVAPFVPPVRKPACKDALQLLLKQARKYGLGCVLATQNPGDVDYKALAQVGTWALGRVTTRQDLAKLAPALRALADDADALVEALPSQGAGELIVLSPDALGAPTPMKTRRLFSGHETFTEARITEAMQDVRARFPIVASAPVESSDAPTPTAPTTAPTPTAPTAPTPTAPTPTTVTEPTTAPTPTTPTPTTPTAVTQDTAPDEEPASQGHALLECLARHATRSEAELRDELEIGPRILRRQLEALEAEGQIHRLERDGTTRWWSPASGARPDLDLARRVYVVRLTVDEVAVTELGAAQCRSGGALGLLGAREELDHVELRHRLLFRVDFEETAPAPLLRRLTGAHDEERVGSVYFHPRTLELLTFHPRSGIAFVGSTNELASDVEDLDGHVEVESAPASSLLLLDEEVRGRPTVPEVQRAFASRFTARATAAALVFVPVWTAVLRADGGKGFRRVTLDGVVGKPVAWP